MKRNLFLILAFFAGMALVIILSWKSIDNNPVQSLHKAAVNGGPVIALRKVKLKAGASAEAFESWAAKLPKNEYGIMPGTKFYIAKGERGDEAGSYLFVIEFDSKQRRDFYYPTAGADSTQQSAEARKMLEPWNKIAAAFTEIGEVVTTGKESYTDYIVLQ